MAESPASNTRHAFAVAPSKPLGFRSEGNNRIYSALDRQRRSHREVKRQGSFGISDTINMSFDSDRYERFGAVQNNKLNKVPQRTGSYGAYDWSRHSRGASDDTRDSDVTLPEDSSSTEHSKQTDRTYESDLEAVNNDLPNDRVELISHISHTDGRCVSPRVLAINSNNTSFDSDTSQDITTPTNIRRKLKSSFDILPNYKKNASDNTTGSSKAYRQRAESPRDSHSVVQSGKSDHSEKDAANNPRTDTSAKYIPRSKILLKSKSEPNLNGYNVQTASSKCPRSSRASDHITGNDVGFTVTGTQSAVGTIPDRPMSAGTSGYSTDETSCKVTDSEDDNFPVPVERKQRRYVIPRKHRNKYFVILQNGTNMALKVDNSMFENGEQDDESYLSQLLNVSISDLAIPDHVGWLIDQSEQNKVWGVVIDMLFCVFEDQGAAKPCDVIILPGCNIRPLVYNTAINGINNNNSHSQTVTGISTYQFVIDDASTGKKHVFGVDTQGDLDTWFRILKKASALDPEVTNDITLSNSENEPPSAHNKNRRASFDDLLPSVGYMPSTDSTRRSVRMKSSASFGNIMDCNGNADETSGSRNDLTNGNHMNSRGGQGLARSDSTRASVKDFKKRMRQEPKPEISKQQPVKATHFQSKQPAEESRAPQGKKLRSFGSFESLLKFKRKKRKPSEDSVSNDDSSSIVSGSSIEQDIVSRSVDISANVSKLQSKRSKKMSRSLELEPKNGMSNGIARRASDIKDRVFSRRSSKPYAKLGDLHDTSMHGVLLHKHHLKWQKLWCVVCRGCFYGFKSNSPEECAQLAVMLANCTVVFVSEQDKKQKHLYIFKLSQERAKSIYLCVCDYKELMQWLTVLQMESNSVISNADRIRKSSESENDSICSSLSSQSGSVGTVSSGDQPSSVENSRSRSKKKKQAPVKPPRKYRNSSCPPSVNRDSGTSTGEETLTSGSSGTDNTYGSAGERHSEELPRYDKAVSHVWQNDRGYLFNAIRAKLSAYRRKDESTDSASTERMMIVQDGVTGTGSRPVRRTRSFNTHTNGMSESEQPGTSQTTPSETSPSSPRKRHKPLVVKKIAAKDLAEKQEIGGYLEKKSFSTQWIKYWYVLHQGTLFCYLTSDDNVTVDVLNLHGYTVISMVDKFRGKRFVIQLSHENFISLYLSMESREEMDQWERCLQMALKEPSSPIKEGDTGLGACASCENNRQDDVGEKRKQVKQKLLEEMLRQKYELERKQAARQKKQRGAGTDSPDGSPSSPYPQDTLTDEQRTSDVTRLRQRRMSAQLKVETIQKQLEKPNGNRRGLFGFGKAKKLDENKNVFLQDQLKELNQKLHKIDNEMSQVEVEKKLSETFDVNQNRKSMPAYVPYTGNGEHRLDEEEENKHNSGLKNAVQKWTNKTFSKSSVKKRPINGMTHNGSVPNLKQNGDINMNGMIEHYHETEEYHSKHPSLESSVTDLTRPLADLKLDLNLTYPPNGQSDSGSPSSGRYNRSTSKSSTLSSLSSPRREINPSVLAEIDAFEELTRQVLGARSKEVPSPTK